MLSEPICMFACPPEEPCNFYMGLDDDDKKDMEFETCEDSPYVRIEQGMCYDSMCDTWERA